MYRRMVTSPDGVEWQVRVLRVWFPDGAQSDYDPQIDGTATGLTYGRPVVPGIDLLEYLVIGPIMWFIAPLFRTAFLLPVAMVRGLFSRNRWIEAHGQWPNEKMAIVWRARAADATAVAEHVASGLVAGYNGLTPAGAKLVHATSPPAIPAPRPVRQIF